MAADVVLGSNSSNPSNPCCAELKKKYAKVKSKRKALMRGCKAIEVTLDQHLKEKAQLVRENSQLEKVNEELLLRGKQEKGEGVTEFSTRQKLESEIHDLQGQISSYQKNQCLINVNNHEIQLLKARILESQDAIKRLEDLLEKEKKKSDSVMKKAELEKKKAAQALKLVKLEKKKAAEALKLVKLEKNKADEGSKLVEIERKTAEKCRFCLEKANLEAKEVKAKLNAELFKVENTRKRVEKEKQKTGTEKAPADSLVIKAGKHKRLMEIERTKANDEKVRADRLSHILEEEKQRREELRKKIEENVPTPIGRCDSCNCEERYNGDVSINIANMKLLREQLKLEKKLAKYARKMAKLEKAEKSCIMKELHILKQSFMQILSRFNILDDRLSHSVEGTDAGAKIGKPSEIHGSKLQNSLLGSRRCNHCSRIDSGMTETFTGSFNFTEPRRECVDLPLTRGSCTGPTTGIVSDLESLFVGSDRNKSQSSAVCSNTSYSDKRSVGSQERVSIAVTTSAKLTKKHPNKRPIITKLSSEVTKSGKIKEIGVMENNVDKTCGHREVRNACLTASMHGELGAADGVFDRSSKRRKAHHTMEPVASIPTHFKIGGTLSGFENSLNVAGGITAVNCSQGDGIFQKFHNGLGCFSEDNIKSCRGNINHTSKTMASKLQIPVLQDFGRSDIQKQCGKFDSVKNRYPNPTEITPPSYTLRGISYIEQDGNLLSNGRADLNIFENMIRDNCLKFLDLDNDADEERYRMAVQTPLSPTMPDPELCNRQLCVEDDAQNVMERAKPMLYRPVDIMSTKINISNAALDLPSCEVQDSLLTKDPGKICTIKLQNCVSGHGRLNSDKYRPLFSGNHGSQYGEQTCPPGKSDDNDSTMVQFLESYDAFPNSNSSRVPVSGVINKPLLSGDISGSYGLHDDGCLQSSTLKIDNHLGSESQVVNKQNKANGCVGTRNPGLVENQIDGKVGAPDGTIVYSSNSQALTAEIKKFTMINKNVFNAEIAKQGSIHQLSEDSRQTALSTSCNAEDSSRTNPVDEVGRTPVCCVLFSKIKNKDSISRILHWRYTFSRHSFLVSPTDHVVVQVHNALAMDTILLPEEKGGVLFSLLLGNISSRISANFKCTMGEYQLPCIMSFAAEVNEVLSDAETKSLFKEICQIDVLGSLAEDFLIERKVIVCSDSLNECNDTLCESFQLDGVYVCSRAATTDQFVAGCIILASLSAAAERIGFLLEASYRILLTCRNDVSWILLAMHVFASVCGKEFFNIEEYSFLTIVLRSVVLSLERGHQAVSPISPFVCSVFEREPSFPPCRECPFAMGAVCMEKLINLLLDTLQCYILSGNGYPNVNNAVNFSVCMVPLFTEKDVESRANKSELDSHTNASEASCGLLRFRKHAADLPDCFPEKAFCHFSDIVSLLELVGCYMSWEWTYNKILPHLTKMLESCKSEEFSVALFVLIGQLGRFGIDVGGHQKEGVAELRCIISVFVDSRMERKMSFPTQLAAIGSLLNLLPLSLRDVVGEHKVLSMDTSQCVHAELIKEWFSKLTKQQQSLSLNLF